MKTKYVFFWSMAIYAILTTPIQADVIKANSCSQQDVRAAIDKAIDGDTVWVPAGRCAWTLGITKNNMPAITLQGAGETEGTGTVLENQTAGAWENTLLWLTSSGGKRLKIEKFRFIGKGNGNGSVHLQGFRDLRVSHCSFQRTEGSGYMLQTDDAYGVIDHCDFTEAAISVGDNRDEAWTRPYVFGSSDATVIENCAFNYSPASLAYGFVSGWGGCRFVLRFNEIMNGGLNNHETCTSDNRGGMVMEVYKNTFISTSNRDQAIAMRGGTGVVFNNVFQGDWFKTINSYNLLIERARQRCDAANTCVAAFMTQCDHYPCLDQLGRQANQAWEPVYLWNNLQNGELRGLEIADCDADYGFVLASRDYFNNTPRPGYIPYPYPHPLTVQGENCRLLGLQGVENAGTVKLTWKAISGAAGYRVRRNWDEVVALGAVATEYSENAGGYLYLVEALSSGATVLASEGVITDTQKPTVPTDLSANLFSGTRIDLTWSSSTDDLSLSGYRIYRDGARIVISGITSYSDTNLSPHTQYSYTVTAFDAAGNESAPSSEVAVTTLASGVGGGDSGGGGGGGCFITTVTYSSGPWIGLPALFLFFLGIGFVGLWWGKRSFNIRPDGAGNLDLLGCNFHAIKSTKEKTMRTKSLFAIAFLLLLLINLSAGAANHYVCEGATGANNGSDWNNAFTDLPATLIRGNTYFIADGNYCPNGYRFDDPMDGDKYIKVLKATVSSHGTDVGWDDQYGDGQAVFTETLSFKTSYWVFDGVVGGTPVPGSILPDPDAYGFRVKGNDTKYGVAHYLFQAPQSAAMNYLQISHCALIQLGYDFDTIEYEGEQVAHYGQSCIYVGGDYSKNNYLISNNYMANASTLLTFYNTSNSIIENNYFVSNWSSHYSHGQLVAPGQSSNDLIFRNNVFYHPAVFVFGTHNTGGTGDERWQVYNNLVIGDGSKSNAGFANADSAKPDSMLNCDFHHNIFYNFDFGRGAVFIGDVSAGKVESGKSRVYNNIFYKVKDVGMSGENYTP